MPTHVAPKGEVSAAFDEARPGVLGLLFDASSCALRNQRTTVLAESPRMLDFATWVEAGTPAFGWGPGRFLRAYTANRRDASTGILEGSFVGQFIPRLAEQGFMGTATECLRKLEMIAGTEATRRRGWPATPRGLSGILRRLTPALADSGIVVAFDRAGHERQRVVRVHRADIGHISGEILPFAKPSLPKDRRLLEVVGALRAVGIDRSWEVKELAALALRKAVGDADLAADALNDLDLPARDGGRWTAKTVRMIR